MALAPPILSSSVPYEVREYLRRLNEDQTRLNNDLKALSRHSLLSDSISPSPPSSIIVEQRTQVIGLGQLQQGQFTYAPVVLSLPPVGDPLSQNGQIVFLSSGGMYIVYIFDGTVDPGIWREASALSTSLMAMPTCLAFNSANQSIANSIEQLLTYDSEVYDTDTIHSTSSLTGRLTCKTAGKYSIVLNINFAQNSTGIRFASIRLNGSTLIAAQDTKAIDDGASRTFLSVTAQYILAINDFVDSTAFQNSGAGLNVEATGKEPNFGMILVSI